MSTFTWFNQNERLAVALGGSVDEPRQRVAPGPRLGSEPLAAPASGEPLAPGSTNHFTGEPRVVDRPFGKIAGRAWAGE